MELSSTRYHELLLTHFKSGARNHLDLLLLRMVHKEALAFKGRDASPNLARFGNLYSDLSAIHPPLHRSCQLPQPTKSAE